MILVIDKSTKNVICNFGGNSAFPSGDIPNLDPLPDGQEYIRLHDDSDFANLIKSAHTYDLDFEITYTEELQTFTDTTLDPETGEPTYTTREELVQVENKDLIGVIVTKTKAQYQDELEQVVQEPTTEERLGAMEMALLAMMEGGI